MKITKITVFNTNKGRFINLFKSGRYSLSVYVYLDNYQQISFHKDTKT